MDKNESEVRHAAEAYNFKKKKEVVLRRKKNFTFLILKKKLFVWEKNDEASKMERLFLTETGTLKLQEQGNLLRL